MVTVYVKDKNYPILYSENTTFLFLEFYDILTLE